jgi:hypothetical protein
MEQNSNNFKKKNLENCLCFLAEHLKMLEQHRLLNAKDSFTHKMFWECSKIQNI